MTTQFEDFLAISQTLLDDVQACQKQLNVYSDRVLECFNNKLYREAEELEAESQFWRRSLVRAFYAMVEGNIFGLKQIALSLQHRCENPLTEAERAMIGETSYDLKDNGVARSTKAKIKLESNFKFAFKIYIQVTKIPLELDFGSRGWNAFTSSIHVRDRLMHPKTYENVIINGEELIKIAEASAWFNQIMQNLLNLSAPIFDSEEDKRK